MNFVLPAYSKSLSISAVFAIVSFICTIGVARADYTINDVAPYVYTAPALPSGSLIASISFDQIESVVASDSSGNANDAVLSDDSVWAPGISGSAISFDGGDNRALIPNDVIGTGSVTACAWYNVNSTPAGAVLISNNAFSISIDASGTFEVSNNGGANTVSATSQIVPGNWEHVCVARSQSGDASIYINGVLNAQGNAGMPISGTEVSIGNSSWNDDHGFDGMVDEVRIYAGALSASQISALQ
ncbi:MAG TPA: LamG domain-containing protein [Candidatus Paceibacterota bacterium]|jgi:hypothetical protein|nr:LamG domain-containing protein [Candidatus Paceibacterota bacterium]